MFILELQKLIGPKFILPSFLKKLPYNYYMSEEEEAEWDISSLEFLIFAIFFSLMYLQCVELHHKKVKIFFRKIY